MPSRIPQAVLNDQRHVTLKIQRVGRDKTPVLIVDNVLANAEEIRDCALQSAFRRPLAERDYYPGYVSYSSLRGVQGIAEWVTEILWHRGFGLSRGRKHSRAGEIAISQFFAIFAPARHSRLFNVHADGHSFLAMLIYLSPGLEEKTGTSFWRHRPTGLQCGYNGPESMRRVFLIEDLFGAKLLPRARGPLIQSGMSTYREWVNSLFMAPGNNTFADGPHGPWESIGHVSARFNRLVAYPTWQFHGVVMKRYEPPKSIEKARLTLNVFVRHPVFEPLEYLPTAPIPGLDPNQ